MEPRPDVPEDAADAEAPLDEEELLLDEPLELPTRDVAERSAEDIPLLLCPALDCTVPELSPVAPDKEALLEALGPPLRPALDCTGALACVDPESLASRPPPPREPCNCGAISET